MSHSYYKIWLHVVFSTKNRELVLYPPIESAMHTFLRQELITLGCPVRIINGMPDHLHLLFLQNPTRSVADIIRQIKGSSSHWINAEAPLTQKFAWQKGYGAFSVSESQLEKAALYIKNQKNHHAKLSYEKELEGFLKLHKIELLTE